MTGSNAQHYKLVRTCDTNNVLIIPIILFDENQLMVKRLTLASCLSAAKLIVVCLFKIWYSLLLSPTPLDIIIAYILDFWSAKVFSNIMDSVKLYTGWRLREIVGYN